MPGWAFDNIIEFVRQNVHGYSYYYDFTIYNHHREKKVASDLNATETNRSQTIQYKQKLPFSNIPVLRGLFYRLICAFNKWGWVDYNNEGKKRRLRGDNSYDAVVYLDYYMDKDADFTHINANHIIRGIYTAGFPPRGIQLKENLSVDAFVADFLKDADALVVGAPSIAKIYEDHFQGDVFFANMAYDEQIFTPSHRNAEHEELVIGWTGNPNREFKGFHSIIVPAIEELQQEGYAIQLKTQFEGTLNSLAVFWQSCDLAVITSEADAGPSLFMEASLCGVPSISTRIGMPAYVIEHEKNGLFIKRNKEELKEAIIRVYKDKGILESMKKVIRQDYLDKLGKDIQVKNWKVLFEKVLNG